MNTYAKHTRLDYLDAVRAFALLLGIVFHASLSFMPIFIGWAVMDVSTSNTVPAFVLLSHSFRMPLFFLIAGYFSHMTFSKKGFGSFAKSRLVRIAIPFVLGWFLLRPLVVSAWMIGAESMRGEANVLAGLLAGFQTLNTLPQGLLTGTHLWFLYYLLLATTATLAIRFVLTTSPVLHSFLSNAADKALNYLSTARVAIPLLALPCSVCLWFMNSWGMDTPDKNLIPHLPALLAYGFFFSIGWLTNRQARIISSLAKLSLEKFLFAAIGIGAILYLSPFESSPQHPHYLLLKSGFTFGYALCMWSLGLLTIGLFKEFCDRPSKKIRYLADSSYWLYLIHLPIVLWLQIAFAELPCHWTLKLVAITGLTISLSLIIYDLLVRPTLLGKILNGSRKQSLLLSKAKRAAIPQALET